MRRGQQLSGLWLGAWAGLFFGRIVRFHLLRPDPSWDPSPAFDPRVELAAVWVPALLMLAGAVAGWFAGARPMSYPLVTTIGLLFVAAATFAVLHWTAQPGPQAEIASRAPTIWSRMLSFIRYDGGAFLMIAAMASLMFFVANEPRKSRP